MKIRTLTAVLLLGMLAPQAFANDAIVNFREYSPLLASSGQPTAEQLETIATAGFERVVYLAFDYHDSALADEDRIARELGMQFVQIPVVWDAPTLADYAVFAAVLKQGGDQRTLVHCQINWRASSFVFLYRVLELGVPLADAKLDLNRVWAPEPGWRQFIFDVLASRGVSPDCELCDWSLTEE